MKQKLIAVAVAGAMSIPAAVSLMPTTVSAGESGPTVYGRVRLGLQYLDADASPDSVIGMERDSSRLGIKGEEDLGNGMSAIYRYEFEVFTAEDDGTASPLGRRNSFVGLKGNFGQVTVGRQVNLFYGLTGTSYALGNSYTGSGFAMGSAGLGTRFSDSIQYRVSTGDLTIGGDLHLRQSDPGTQEDVDGFDVAARYNYGAGRISAGYADITSTDENGVSHDGDVSTLFVDYNIGESGMVYIGAMFADSDDNGEVDSFHIGYNGRSGDVGYFISYDGLSYDLDETKDTDYITLGTALYLSGRTRLYFEVENKSVEADNNDQTKAIVGIRHDF